MRLLTYLTPELDEVMALAGIDADDTLDVHGLFRCGGEVVDSLAALEAALAR